MKNCLQKWLDKSLKENDFREEGSCQALYYHKVCFQNGQNIG